MKTGVLLAYCQCQCWIDGMDSIAPSSSVTCLPERGWRPVLSVGLRAAQIERDPYQTETSGEICLWGTYCIPLYLADRFMDIDGPTNRPWWFPSSPSPSSSHRICLSNHSFPLSPVGRIECNCDSSRLARRWSHSNVILSAICFTEDITADLHITFFLEIRTRSVPCASRPHPLSLSSWRWSLVSVLSTTDFHHGYLISLHMQPGWIRDLVRICSGPST